MSMQDHTEKQKLGPSETISSALANIKALWSTHVAVDFFSDEGTLTDHLGKPQWLPRLSS